MRKRNIRKAAAALTALALCAGVLSGCGGAASSTASSAASSSAAASSEASGEDADEAAAKNVADLIDAIYVQERNDNTDEQCAAAKAAWDSLTDAQKELVEGENADPDYFGRDTGDASKDAARNEDNIGENELLVVSFGTSFNDSRVKDIKGIEDALQATRAAVEEGIVAGGGVAFMDAAPALDAVEIDDPEEKIGVDIVKKALTAPVATIAKNAGFEGAVVVDKVAELPAGQGLNSANGEWGDMIEMGVLDPVKVSRVTLQNAASVASLILITEATVSDVPKNTQLEDAIAAATAGQQGGGMY